MLAVLNLERKSLLRIIDKVGKKMSFLTSIKINKKLTWDVNELHTMYMNNENCQKENPFFLLCK